MAQNEPEGKLRLRKGKPAANLDIAHLADADKIRDFLHKTLDLSDEAFEDLCNDVGYRAALLILRAKAVTGDIKALELYIRLCRELKKERKKVEAKPVASPENAAFVQVRIDRSAADLVD